MKLNLSIKTLLLIQILLVLLLIPMDIFLGEVRLDYVLPLYTLVWILTYSQISKKKMKTRKTITYKTTQPLSSRTNLYLRLLTKEVFGPRRRTRELTYV